MAAAGVHERTCQKPQADNSHHGQHYERQYYSRFGIHAALHHSG
jgi:hypothetical protein